MKLLLSIFLITFSCCAQNLQELFQKAYALNTQQQYQEALELYKQLDSVAPNIPEVLCNIGYCLNRLNMPAQAIEIYEKARLEYSTPNPHIERALSHSYLAVGEFKKGLKAHEYRWKIPPPYNADLKNYIEQGGSLKDKKIIINTEYGFGDIFQFLRYIQVLKNMGAYTIVVCHKPELIQLLKLCPYIDIIASPDQTLPHADFQALLMSLPYILNTTLETIPQTIPYIYTDQTLIKKWAEIVKKDSNLKIGICWQADMHTNSQNTSVQHDALTKSIPLSLISQLSIIPGISLYSLQKTVSKSELEQLPKSHRLIVFDDLDKDGAFIDTSALITNMDLIISIDTSIAHLAAGLGKPVITLLPFHSDWRWMLDRSDSPWYPTMHLIRQSQPNDWLSAIKKTAQHVIAFNNENKTTSIDVYRLYSAGITLIHNDHLDDARFIFELLAEIDQNYQEIFYTLGYILSRLNAPELAVAAYNKTLKINPSHAHAKLGLSKVLLALGAYDKAWPLFEDRFPNPKEVHDTYGYPHLAINDIRGKIVLLHAEWGLGDMIHFVRYADLLRKAGAQKIIVQTFEQLVPLFSLCPLIDQTISIGHPLPHADIHIPTLSLPLLFKTSIDTIPAPIPYMKADDKLITIWQQYVAHDKKFKIGLCWHTKPIYLEDHVHTRRSIPLTLFDQLADIPDLSFYSLQQVHGMEELVNLKKIHFKELPTDFDTTHGRFMDTAALIMHLDLIITADTSICHLAGALGKQVWLLLPYCPEWRWLPGHTTYKQSGKTPWYPNNTRLFYQKKPGHWNSVIQEIKEALIDQLKEKERHDNA